MSSESVLGIYFSNGKSIDFEGVSEDDYRTLIYLVGRAKRWGILVRHKIVSINTPSTSVAVTLRDITMMTYKPGQKND